MTDPKKTWADVGEGFETLGRLLKQRFTTHDSPISTEPEASPEERAAVREAFDKLVAAAKDFGDRATDVAKDPEVKAQTKQVARSLNTALSSTVDMIGDEVGGFFKRTKGGSSGGEQDPEKDPG